MKEVGQLILLLCMFKITYQHQRVPPGVNPNQYQQQQYHAQQPQIPVQHQVPHHQQVPVQHHPQVPPHQQVPMQPHQQQQVPVQHHQQVPVQHHQQQVPVQHQQVPVQQQQFAVPQHQGHHPGGQQLLNVANMAHEDKEHIKEHLSVPIDTSNMSEQELQFHYFKMHDADNNNKLDGCELIKSLIHWHVSHGEEADTMTTLTDEDLKEMVDPIFSKADTDNDGFLNYFEYKEHSSFAKDLLQS